jgi:hypothetical protein
MSREHDQALVSAPRAPGLTRAAAGERRALFSVALVAGVAMLAGAASGCGGAQDPETTPSAHPQGEGRRATDPNAGDPAGAATPPNPRQLSVGASFADLVAAVRALDGLGASESEAGCLLRGGDLAPCVLVADLASAVHPIPEAPRDLEARLDDPRAPVVVLTRWAQHGAGAGIALVGLSATPPPSRGHLAVVLLSRQGAHLRRTDAGVSPSHAGPFPVNRLAEHLPVVMEGAAGVVVSAEAGVPLSTLRAALAQVPAGAPPTTLALALEDGVRLPSPPTPDPSTHGMCAAGALPAPPPGQTLGTVAPDAVRERLASMTEGAMRCFEFARGDAARGGRLRVLTRIGAQGRVTEACATTDQLGDPTLRNCVLGVVRGVVFPAPVDGDFVDVALPIRLLPDSSARQRPLCDL